MHENKKCLALQNSSHEKKGQTLEFSFKLPGQIPQTVHKLCFRGIYCKVFFNYLAIEWEGKCYFTFLYFREIHSPDMRKTGSAGSAACVIFVEAVSIFW